MNLPSKIIRNIGSVTSLWIHTILFAVPFILFLLGITDSRDSLLWLTTIVSLEAIYLSIFIQISVNMQARELSIIQKDIEEIQEDVEDIQEKED